MPYKHRIRTVLVLESWTWKEKEKITFYKNWSCKFFYIWLSVYSFQMKVI